MHLVDDYRRRTIFAYFQAATDQGGQIVFYHQCKLAERLGPQDTLRAAALIFKSQLGLYGFVEMLVFMSLLGGGFVYAWKAGALDW